jgi:NAD(P)-dependent dehydrogenase (short-subunit alcohol dehydrogenase family)
MSQRQLYSDVPVIRQEVLVAVREEAIFITGAGSGMGQLAARNYAEQGYQVAALDVNEKGLLETAEHHQNIRTFNTDVTNYASVAEVVEETETRMGPIRRV